MDGTANFLAVDLGASSGRVILGQWDGDTVELRELHRFPNGPVSVGEHIYWDILRLWQDVKTGISRYASEYREPLAGIGVDTWAVDFGLLDGEGRLLGNLYHYRDNRTEGMPEWVDTYVSPERLYARTGIQRLPINTLYQLASMRQSHDPLLDEARTLLLIPDLLHFWLTGRKVAEYTNATTTQFYDAREGRWATDLLDSLGLPAGILPPIVPPGTVLGEILPGVREETGLRRPAPVIASATHDTASAVAAVPGLDEMSAYISSGTWSLVGIEVKQPILSEEARKRNFTNEGGVEGTIRFLRNVAGLWLLQECQRRWERDGKTYTWPTLLAEAERAEPLGSLVDPDAPEFLNPTDMPAAIQAFCRRTGQHEPLTVGQIVRCCLESLALKYRQVLVWLEELAGHRLETIRIVGGGSQNLLLCQLTADACERPVVAGPVEATALGNILVQAVAAGYLPDISAGRRAVGRSATLANFTPRSLGTWNAAHQRFAALAGGGS